ncbi:MULTISPECIES: hypothetical protein [unclassified Butyrivibrio]|uniref:hypothetical protein n=2 Tax=unclassified Butyrivibrio TaxID=2639466 RepID=UPI001FA76807|nr:MULTISPECIES: hypothetical protein [unclassified Butyrivibrio]
MIMLLTMLFMICIFGFVGKLIGFAFRFSWSLIKVAFFLVFLPFILIAMVAYGLIYIALPVLVVAMIVGLLVKEA